MTLALDHLVVAAPTLEAGAAWCETVFGVVPQPGGKHAAMATHNLLLNVSSARFARTYLEIIAIDDGAPAPSRVRWFDLDAPALRAAISTGPRLVHWVARATDIEAAAETLRRAGHEVGTISRAERMTARGLLSWRITLRDDGGRPAQGAVPLLIAWGDVHPTDSLPLDGVGLEALRLGVPVELATMLGADAGGDDAPPLAARLSSPRGVIDLVSPGA